MERADFTTEPGRWLGLNYLAANVVMTRSLLRGLPILIARRGDPRTQINEARHALSLPALRAASLLWTAVAFPDQLSGLAEAANQAGHALWAQESNWQQLLSPLDKASFEQAEQIAVVARLALGPVWKPVFPHTDDNDREQVLRTVSCAYQPTNDYKENAATLAPGVLEDVAEVERKMPPTELTRIPLWDHEPQISIETFEKTLLEYDEGWEVWIEWYRRRWFGLTADKRTELLFCSAPEDAWTSGPAAVNGWIRQELLALNPSTYQTMLSHAAAAQRALVELTNCLPPHDDNHPPELINEAHTLSAGVRGELARNLAIALAQPPAPADKGAQAASIVADVRKICETLVDSIAAKIGLPRRTVVWSGVILAGGVSLNEFGGFLSNIVSLLVKLYEFLAAASVWISAIS